MEYSLGLISLKQTNIELGLNPYSNGILTWNEEVVMNNEEEKVLILILMEYSLGVKEIEANDRINTES